MQNILSKKVPTIIFVIGFLIIVLMLAVIFIEPQEKTDNSISQQSLDTPNNAVRPEENNEASCENLGVIGIECNDDPNLP